MGHTRRIMFPTWKNQPRPLYSRLALLCLRLAGWTPLLEVPPSLRVVAVIAPHTHNNDFWVGLGWLLATRVPLRWVAKKQIFREPLGAILRALGGIALDRSKRGGQFVNEAAKIIKNSTEIVLALAPEGSRSHMPYWKTGFYYMALESNAVIGILIIDWKNKRVGLSNYIEPTGDINSDFRKIAAYLDGIEGCIPENQGPVIPKPRV